MKRKYGVSKNYSKNLAKKIVSEYNKTEEGIKESEELLQEALDYIAYGKPTRYLNEELLDEIKNYEKNI